MFLHGLRSLSVHPLEGQARNTTVDHADSRGLVPASLGPSGACLALGSRVSGRLAAAEGCTTGAAPLVDGQNGLTLGECRETRGLWGHRDLWRHGHLQARSSRAIAPPTDWRVGRVRALVDSPCKAAPGLSSFSWMALAPCPKRTEVTTAFRWLPVRPGPFAEGHGVGVAGCGDGALVAMVSGIFWCQARELISWLGLSKRGRSPHAATMVRRDWCTGRRAGPGARRRRDGGARSARRLGVPVRAVQDVRSVPPRRGRLLGKRCAAGVGQTTSLRQRRGAGPQGACPVERLAWRSERL